MAGKDRPAERAPARSERLAAVGEVRAVDEQRAARVGREPLRVIRDPYPAFSAVVVDMERDEVIVADENLFQILVYDRQANTPPRATSTEPRRVLGGNRSSIEYVAALYVDQRTGDVFATHGDTTNMVAFSRTQRGDVPPARQLRMPKARGIAVDEKNEELFVTSQHDSAVLAFRKNAEGEEAPVRLLQGDRTKLANPHGIAIDRQHNLIFVANHGQVSSRSADGVDKARLRPNWPLERSLAVAGTGRFLEPSVTVYPRTASGNTPPVRVIQGPKTQLNWPATIVFDDKRRELFVANDTGHSILVFREGDQGDVAPIRVLKGPGTGLRYPAGLFLDTKNDELWVANYGNHSLTVYRPTSEGDTPPLRTIRSGPKGSEALMIGNPGALGYDPKREEILVPN